MKRLAPFLIVILLLILPKAIEAQDKPVQIAIINPIQLFNENNSITGLRINLLYGRNRSVTGIDFGLINHTTNGTSTGVQWGFVGINNGNFVGWQNDGVNITHENFEGLQWGIVNYAGSVNGVQIGLVNYAANMKKGLQIGLVNIIKRGGQFPVFPIVNWAF